MNEDSGIQSVLERQKVIMDSAATDPPPCLPEMGELKARIRRSLAHGPCALVCPALALAALPLLSSASHPATPFSSVHQLRRRRRAASSQFPLTGPACRASQRSSPRRSYAFCFLAAPLAFVLVAQWYRHRGRRHGHPGALAAFPVRSRSQWACSAC